MSKLILFALLFLTACGFQPLYGERNANKNIVPQLAQIQVGTIANASGQKLRNLLLDQLPPPQSQPRYQLNVSLTETTVGIAIARDATVTRQQLRSTIYANMTDRGSGQTVWSQSLFVTSGYNVLGSQFSTLIGEEDARTRNLNDLSERLVNMLALYFERGGTANAPTKAIPVAPATLPSPLDQLRPLGREPLPVQP